MEQKTSASPINEKCPSPVEKTRSNSDKTDVKEEKNTVDAQKSKSKLLCYNVFIPRKECKPAGVESKRISAETQSDDEYYDDDDDDDDNPMQIDESADLSPPDLNNGPQLLNIKNIKTEVDQDSYRIQKRRETNRRAAQKCRQKQTEREAILRQEFFETESQNTRLHYEIMQLQKSKELLEKILHNQHCVIKKARLSPEEEEPVNMVKSSEPISPVEIAPIPITTVENMEPYQKSLNTMDTQPTKITIAPISIQPSHNTQPKIIVAPVSIQPSYITEPPKANVAPVSIQPSYITELPKTNAANISIQPSYITESPKTNVAPVSIQPSYNSAPPKANVAPVSIQSSYITEPPKTIVAPVPIQPRYNTDLPTFIASPVPSSQPQQTSQPSNQVYPQPQPQFTPDGFKIPQSVPRRIRASKVIKQINAEELRRILKKGGKIVPVVNDDMDKGMALKHNKLKAIYSNKPPTSNEIVTSVLNTTEKEEKEERKEKGKGKKKRKSSPSSTMYKPQFILPKTMPDTQINNKHLSKEEFEEMKKAAARTSLAATALLELNQHGSERVNKNLYEPHQLKHSSSQPQMVTYKFPPSVFVSAQQEIINNVSKAIILQPTTNSGNNIIREQSLSNSNSHTEKFSMLQSVLLQNLLKSRSNTIKQQTSANSVPPHGNNVVSNVRQQRLTDNSSQSGNSVTKPHISESGNNVTESNVTGQHRLANSVLQSGNNVSKQNSSKNVVQNSTSNIFLSGNGHSGPQYMKRRDFHLQNELKRTASERLESVQSPQIISPNTDGGLLYKPEKRVEVKRESEMLAAE